MADVKNKILEILNIPQLASFATLTEDGKPWVRYVMIKGGNDLTIRFAAFVHSRKVNHIEYDPEVHLTCGISDPTSMTPYLQIQGKAILSTDPLEKQTFWNDHLGQIFKGPDDPEYCVIIVKPYRIEYCTPGSFTPEVWSAS